MAFIETPRFPDDISYGSSGGPMFNTTVVITHSGQEQRNREWTYPLHVYDVGYGIRDEEDVLDIKDFFWAMGGQLDGFRFKDWADYSTGNPGGGTSGNPTVSDSDVYIGTGAASQTAAQLIKTYTKGTITFTRQILKPVSGTVLVALDGTPLTITTEFTVDTATGIITFVTPLTGGEAITAGFEFDVPVRFDSDVASLDISDHSVMSTQIKLRELRNP